MEPIVVGTIAIGVMFVLMLAGVPIGFAMALAAVGGGIFIIGLDPMLALLGQTAFETAITYDLSIVPLFVLMGYFASGSGLSEELFRACNVWLGHRRGGLALATIGGCGAFAAVCGSSIATAATMSQIAMPEMRRYHYDDRLATGAIAAGGTIGILIPPSVILALYGILTQSNISHLFLSGVLPGILSVVAFMATISILTRINPALGPRGVKTSVRAKLLAFKDVWGMVVLFALVIGGIYLGVFTPTEAAAVGAVGALALAVARRRMTASLLVRCLVDTVKRSSPDSAGNFLRGCLRRGLFW